MAKWYGNIGFIKPVEVEPGIWKNEIVEHQYYGDVIRNTRGLQPSDGVNDNINLSNNISIISDPYANQNFHYIKYAEFMGTNWNVTNVDVQYPRLILTMGGVYNGE